MTDARTAAARDAGEIAGLNIHQRYLAAQPVMNAAMDAAISDLRYPDDVSDVEAMEFLDYVFDKPAAAELFTNEALSESATVDLLTILRLVREGQHTGAGQVVAHMVTDYARRILEVRLTEKGYERDEMDADHARDLWLDRQMEARS
jgi:hypothetical protein